MLSVAVFELAAARRLDSKGVFQAQSSGAFAVVLAEQLVASVVVQTSYMLAQQNLTTIPTVRSSGFRTALLRPRDC